MDCEYCGRAIPSAPLGHKLMDRELNFCSGRCAAAFNRRFVDALARIGVPGDSFDAVSLLPGPP